MGHPIVDAVQAIFKKPEQQSNNQNNKGTRKPLSEAQKRKIEKKRQFWENRRKREELERERKGNQPERPKLLCRFYKSGNCHKVSVLVYNL